EALGIGAEEVAGVEHFFPGKRARAKRTRCRYLVLPIALHDVSTADDKLTDSLGSDARALVVDDERLGGRDGDPHRPRTTIKLDRRQIGAAFALGHAIHRIEPHAGKELAEPRDM